RNRRIPPILAYASDLYGLSNQFAQLPRVPRHGDFRVLGGFILESDVTAVVGGAQHLNFALEVGFLRLAAFALDLGLDLHDDGVRSQSLQVGVRVLGAEVAGVEV